MKPILSPLDLASSDSVNEIARATLAGPSKRIEVSEIHARVQGRARLLTEADAKEVVDLWLLLLLLLMLHAGV